MTATPESKTRSRPRRRAARTLHRPKKQAQAAVRSDINVTPLVDVMLVLLIIFIVVTPMLTTGKPVHLPRAEYYLTQKDDGTQIVVSVTAPPEDGIFMGKEALSLDGLRGRITQAMRDKKGAPIVVKADQRLNYRRVREVMETIHDAGAETILLATQDEKGY